MANGRIVKLSDAEFQFLTGLLQGVKDDLAGVSTQTVVGAMTAGVERLQHALKTAEDLSGD